MKCCNTFAKFDESRKEHSQIIIWTNSRQPAELDSFKMIYVVQLYSKNIFLFLFCLVLHHTYIYLYNTWFIWGFCPFWFIIKLFGLNFLSTFLLWKNDVMFITLNDKPFSKLTNITNDQNGMFNLIQHMIFYF